MITSQRRDGVLLHLRHASNFAFEARLSAFEAPLKFVCIPHFFLLQVRALDCTSECWYYGVIQEHVRLKFVYIPRKARETTIYATVLLLLFLLVSQVF
jgi:hypothetical protein